jgi:hypothetical protein
MRTPEFLRYLIGPLELIHGRAGPGLLRLTRLGVFLLWIVKLLLDPLWRLALLPREMRMPVGILNLFPVTALDALFTASGLTTLLFVTLVVLVLCLTNRAFPVVSTLAAILLTVYSSVIRSFGPAVHTDITLLLAVYALAAFSWADWFEDKFRKAPKVITGPNRLKNFFAPESRSASYNRNSYPLITIVAMLCLSYCLVGLNRTVAGGINVFTGDSMESWAVDASLRGYYFNTNIGWHIPQWPWVGFMLRSGLPAITFFEITAPLCLASSHYRWVFIPVMLSFHLLSLVVMNIFFFDDMFLYLLLVDWSRRFPVLRAKEQT